MNLNLELTFHRRFILIANDLYKIESEYRYMISKLNFNLNIKLLDKLDKFLKDWSLVKLKIKL